MASSSRPGPNAGLPCKRETVPRDVSGEAPGPRRHWAPPELGGHGRDERQSCHLDPVPVGPWGAVRAVAGSSCSTLSEASAEGAGRRGNLERRLPAVSGVLGGFWGVLTS